MTTPRTDTPLLKKKTDFQEARDARDLAIYNEYNALASDKEQSRTQINAYLMKKYDLHSNGTLYAIRRRVERRLSRKGVKI